MPNTYQIGRVGQVYAHRETTYGTAATLVSADAIRHLMVKLDYSPRNRVDAPDRYTHPSLITRRTRRETGTWGFNGIFFPSGTLNTVPDHDEFLVGAFGQTANTTLATTFSGTPTTTTGTVASATSLAIGQFVVITIAAGGPTTYVRMLTGVSGLNLTWDPALPTAPAAADACAGCITYQLSTALPQALTIAHYLTSFSFEGHGCVVDQLKLTLDANNEAMLDVSGPMAERIRNAQAQPGSYTTAGTAPPSGLSLTLRVGSAAYEILKCELSLANGMDLDNFPAGISKAQSYFRRKKRAAQFAIEAMYSSDVTLLGAAEATTDQVLLAQQGSTIGNIIGMYAPHVEFEVPSDPDADETNTLAFKGYAKGLNGNDEVYLCCA